MIFSLFLPYSIQTSSCLAISAMPQANSLSLGRTREEVEWHGMKVKVWEPWATENWGTTRNACDAYYSAANEVSFDTAWCEPIPVFEALAKRFPEHEMVVISDVSV